MRNVTAAAVAAIFSASAAQAVVLDLSYTVEAELASYRFVVEHEYYRYFGAEPPVYAGPEVGDVAVWDFFVSVDTEDGDPGGYYHEFDPASGVIHLGYFGGHDNQDHLHLFADGTGERTTTLAIPPDYYHSNFAHHEWKVISWSVVGLPKIAPVPLPASLPLLMAGFGAFAAIRRKQRRRPA